MRNGIFVSGVKSKKNHKRKECTQKNSFSPWDKKIKITKLKPAGILREGGKRKFSGLFFQSPVFFGKKKMLAIGPADSGEKTKRIN
uniref:Uncharacterized protein n=1 Tax=Panagrolaimus sp. JU765 TaxID=591449 RepID=A0AC34QZD6_9BILA